RFIGHGSELLKLKVRFAALPWLGPHSPARSDACREAAILSGSRHCPCMAVGGLRTGSCSSLESRLNRCLLGSAGFSPNVSLNAGIWAAFARAGDLARSCVISSFD